MLAALAGTTGPMTAAQVADVVAADAVSPRAAQYALADLVTEGLAIREQVGRVSTYRLNRRHLTARAVIMLATSRRRLIRRLERRFDRWDPEPVRGILFGSAARGDGDSSSDIDIYVERPAGIDVDDPAWSEQRDDLVDRVRAYTGNDVELLELGADEVDARDWVRDPTLAAIARDGVVLHGTPPPRVRLVRRRSSA